MERTAEIRYLCHSSYYVRIDDSQLVFDYYMDKPAGESRSLSSGVIEPGEINGLRTLVFSSHRHPDHFNPVIFKWRGKIDSLRYILSSDIPSGFSGDDIIRLKPRQDICLDGDTHISTLKSTDAGVAFLVDIRGVTIYHAGDLNWWHWDGESKAWNNNMAARFKNEMFAIEGKKIDIAFLTADPRQEFHSLLGLEYFAKNIGATQIFPMHFGDDYSIMDAILEEKAIRPELESVQLVRRRGENFIVNL